MPRDVYHAGFVGNLFQQDGMRRVWLQYDNLQHFLRRMKINLSKANSRTNGHKKRQLSFFLGGKASSDLGRWTSNMDAVRATIKFTMATRRLDLEMEPPVDN